MAFSEESVDCIHGAAAAEGFDQDGFHALVETLCNGQALVEIEGQQMPLIRYRPEVFFRQSGLSDKDRADALHRKLGARRTGDLVGPKSQGARYGLLYKASTINEQAAHAACCWGVGQISGDLADWLGYGTPKALGLRAISGMDGQLELLIRFIYKRGLVQMVRDLDWRGFARLYYGRDQADHAARRMASAYRRISGRQTVLPDHLRVGSVGEPVALLQRQLRGLGHAVAIDGDFGPATRRGLTRFQSEANMKPDAIAGPKVLARLEALGGLGSDSNP